MPKSESATSRRTRNVTPAAPGWRKKLSDECLQYLDAYRHASETAKGIGTQDGDLQSWLSQYVAAQSQFPTQGPDLHSANVEIQPAFAEVLKRAEWPYLDGLAPGDNQVPAGLAEILRVAQLVSTALEDPTRRAQTYLAIGFFWRAVRPLAMRFRAEQFGAAPMDADKMVSLIAMGLEFASNLFRGRWRPPKGRTDIERVSILRFIEEHQLETLKPKELREAVVHAGLSVPEGETWSIALRVRVGQFWGSILMKEKPDVEYWNQQTQARFWGG